MTPEDVASLASKAGYQNTNTLSPDELAEETIPVGGTPGDANASRWSPSPSSTRPS